MQLLSQIRQESTVVNLPRNRSNDREYCCFDYFTVICYDKDNNLIGSRMFIVALVLGIIGFAAFQILIKGTVERGAVSHEPQEKVKFIISSH